MTELSPAAKAILDAAEAGLDGYIELLPPTWKPSVAAALRAAAQKTGKRKTLKVLGVKMAQSQAYCLVFDLLAIADELEGAQ